MRISPRPWLFFDAGNVLVSDDPSGCAVLRALYQELVRTTPRGQQPETIDQFMGRRTDFTLRGGNLWAFVASHEHRLPGSDWREFQRQVRRAMYRPRVWSSLSPAIPGMAEVLRVLKKQGFRLALLANQPPAIEYVFRERGMWNLFDVHGVSDRLGMHKPSLDLFHWGLKEAGITPCQAVMVGDRIDNDIAPAKRLGMSTVWVGIPRERRGWLPSSDFGRAYLESVSHSSVSQWKPRSSVEEPDVCAGTPAELLAVLQHFRPDHGD
jgi:HAD superfamily hydrolase (TIGR01509 family)